MKRNLNLTSSLSLKALEEKARKAAAIAAVKAKQTKPSDLQKQPRTAEADVKANSPKSARKPRKKTQPLNDREIASIYQHLKLRDADIPHALGILTIKYSTF